MLLVLLFTACGGDSRKGPGPAIVRPASAGEPRHVQLGFKALPRELSSEAYAGAFATAAQYGEVIAIQRTPPWQDFLPGGKISQATEDTTRFETGLLKQYGGLKSFYAIDPTDSSVRRARIANLPASIDPREGFDSKELREAFIAYTTYVAKNYRPDYLAIGVEINMLYERNPRQHDAFVDLYRDAYAQAKAASPKTKVFPTFQLEDLEGAYDDLHSAHWELLDLYRGAMDVLAISTYPFVTELGVAGDLRPDYFTGLKTHWDGEILIAETAYPSSPVEAEAVVGTEEDQAVYLNRLLDDAERSGISMVIWLAALDPAFATTGPSAVFRDTGLRKSDGANKLAWSTWEEWARRPLK